MERSTWRLAGVLLAMAALVAAILAWSDAVVPEVLVRPVRVEHNAGTPPRPVATTATEPPLQATQVSEDGADAIPGTEQSLIPAVPDPEPTPPAPASFDFQVRAAMDAGFDREVAEDLVLAVHTYWAARKFDATDHRHSISGASNFFFAVLPQLARHIESGACTVKVVRIPPESRLPRVMVTTTVQLSDRRVGYVANGMAWQVSLTFGTEGNPMPSLFAEIFLP